MENAPPPGFDRPPLFKAVCQVRGPSVDRIGPSGRQHIDASWCAGSGSRRGATGLDQRVDRPRSIRFQGKPNPRSFNPTDTSNNRRPPLPKPQPSTPTQTRPNTGSTPISNPSMRVVALLALLAAPALAFVPFTTKVINTWEGPFRGGAGRIGLLYYILYIRLTTTPSPPFSRVHMHSRERALTVAFPHPLVRCSLPTAHDGRQARGACVQCTYVLVVHRGWASTRSV
jgi:hypothetical protein